MASVSVRQKLIALGPFENCTLIMAKIGYFGRFIPTPPDPTKRQKKFSFPMTLKIFNIKTF